MFDASINRIRTIALTEAVSFLVLLGIAMPLKYALGIPIAVKIVGLIHGVLFVVLFVLLAKAYHDQRLDLGQAGVILGASLVPLVPFFIDKRIKRWASAPK